MAPRTPSTTRLPNYGTHHTQTTPLGTERHQRRQDVPSSLDALRDHHNQWEAHWNHPPTRTPSLPTTGQLPSKLAPTTEPIPSSMVPLEANATLYLPRTQTQGTTGPLAASGASDLEILHLERNTPPPPSTVWVSMASTQMHIWKALVPAQKGRQPHSPPSEPTTNTGVDQRPLHSHGRYQPLPPDHPNLPHLNIVGRSTQEPLTINTRVGPPLRA